MSFFEHLTHRTDGGFSSSGRSLSTPSDAASQFVPRETAEQLNNLAAEIGRLTVSTEDEFLQIGAQLQQFYSDAGNISQLSSAIIAKVSGNETEDAIAGLRALMSRMDSYLQHEKDETSASVAALENILRLLVNVNDALGGFKKVIKVLHMLGISTKIESVRMGDDNAGFYNLAMDVEKLSESIKEKSANIMERKEDLAGMIRETLTKVLQIAATEQGEARTIFDQTHGVLDSFEESRSRYSAAIGRLSGISANISSNTGRIVSSVQFHDITRQQMEHVKEALDEQSEKIGGAGDRDSMLECGYICELQGAQLDNSLAALTSAVSEIIEGLQGVAGSGAEMAAEAMFMVGNADDDGGSFLDQIGKGLGSVTSALAESGDANRSLSTAMASVSETIGHITDFVNDIEDIGSEIELIALNAQIKAARTGSEGAALGVLAEAIQKLSVEARSQSLVVSRTLQEITGASEYLITAIDNDSDAIQSEVHAMIDDLNGLLGSLRSLNNDLLPLLRKTSDASQRLSDAIEQTVSGITVHMETAQVVEPVIAELRRIAETTGAFSNGHTPTDSRKFKELAERYTMHSERRIHESITSGGGAGPAYDAADDLGDNIELF